MKNLNVEYPFKKLVPKREEPFKIWKVFGPLVYQLTLPPHMRCYDVFHAFLLTPYEETAQHRPNFLSPPSDIIGNEEEYEVNAILNHQMHSGVMRYLIQRTGRLTEENSWEPESNLTRTQEILIDYKKQAGLPLKTPAVTLTTIHLHSQQSLARSPSQIQWPLPQPTMLPHPHPPPQLTSLTRSSTSSLALSMTTSFPEILPISLPSTTTRRSNSGRTIRPTWKLLEGGLSI